MPVKVLQLVKTKLISGPAVLRDSNSLILGQVIVLIPVGLVLARFKDNIGQNRLSSSINALNNCYLLLVAWLDLLCLS
jgi:hypothetical protein